jgi:hypothetical protein
VTKNKKLFIAVGGSMLMVAAAIGAIAAFGYTEDPEFAWLRDAPDTTIGGNIAYVTETDSENCVHVVAASGGEPIRLGCSDISARQVSFTSDGKSVVTVGTDYSQPGFSSTAVVYDLQTREEVESFPVAEAGPPSFEGSGELFTSSDSWDYSSGLFGSGQDGAHTVWVARDPDGKDRLVSRRAPGNYDFTSAAYSPDRKWILIQDSDGRLLIGDDQDNARLLVSLTTDEDDDFYYYGFGDGRHAWFQPGQTTGTVDLVELRKTGRLSADMFGDHLLSGNVDITRVTPITAVVK